MWQNVGRIENRIIRQHRSGSDTEEWRQHVISAAADTDRSRGLHITHSGRISDTC